MLGFTAAIDQSESRTQACRIIVLLGKVYGEKSLALSRNR